MVFSPLPGADIDHVLTHASGSFAALANRRLFITGGTGFFGKWLLESIGAANDLLGSNIGMTVLSRNPHALLEAMPHLARRPDIAWHPGDVTDFAFPEGHFDDILHLATPASAAFNRDHPVAMFDTIVSGTRRALDFGVSCGARNFLLASSGAVYGPQPATLAQIPETYTGGPDPCSVASAYAEGKRAAEYLCSAYGNHFGIATKIARCFAFVGPHLPMDAHFAIGNFIGNALGNETIVVKGDGSPYRSYLHAADLAVWLLAILVEGHHGRPYNVGSDEALSIRDLARQVSTHACPLLTVEFLTKASGAPAERYVPDISRARAELSLDVRIPLMEAITRTLAWYRQTSSRTQ